MHPFREAVEAKDFGAIPSLLAENVTFLSPVAFTPYRGRELVAAIIDGAARVFEDFHYVREIDGDRDHALIFKARVGEREIHGCDFLHLDQDGLIAEFCVMVRPLSAARVLAEEMTRQFERITAELGLEPS
jgi:SnoaL-like domain